MSFLTRSRFLGRPLVRRATNWDTIAKVIPAAKQTEMSATVAAFNKRKAQAAAVSLNNSIDFDKYTEVLGADEVAKIRKEFESFSYTDFESAKDEELASVRSSLAKTVSAINDQTAEAKALNQEAKDDLAQEVTFGHVSRDLTVSDTAILLGPEIAEEFANNLENDMWDDQPDPPDINSQRLVELQENWDASVLGPLDENTQKLALEEMATLSAAPSGLDANDRAQVEAIAAELGVEGFDIDDALKNLSGADSVTEEELEIRNEREIWRLIDEANEKTHFGRAQKLLENAQRLKAEGLIEEDATWRAQVVKKAERHALLAENAGATHLISRAELGGLSPEEITAKANAAAELGNYVMAAQYLYEAKVLNGDINPDDFSGRSVSSAANIIRCMLLDSITPDDGLGVLERANTPEGVAFLSQEVVDGTPRYKVDIQP